MIKKYLFKAKTAIDHFTMIVEFYHDYRHYKKWNYNNRRVHTKASQESKILRQTHIIEKGMSLANPRKGFGQAKISVLFDMMDEYLTRNYPIEGIPFQNAINALNEYALMQKSMGYENQEMIRRLDKYQQYLVTNDSAGIKTDTRDNIMRLAHESYPDFFNSRHSMRQFRDQGVSSNDVRDAVKLAQKAPTACNRQASHVYMYSDERINHELGELIAGNTGFDNNEVKNYLVITADVSAFYDAFERNQIYVEAGIFTLALVEALHYYGIASCILQNGEFYRKNKKFKKICKNIPDNERIITFIAVGYYKDEFTYAVSTRKKVEDVFTYN